MSDQAQIYARRFHSSRRQEMREVIWKVLAQSWFPRWIRPTDAVLEVGAGYCLFINEIKAAAKIAVDINPNIAAFAASDVDFIIGSATKLEGVQDESIDVVFSSNFFEHLVNRQELFNVLGEMRRVLRPEGFILTLMPNIDHVKWKFWDFVDHTLPLNVSSLTEALELSNLRVEKSLPKFLPYTAEGRGVSLPRFMWRPMAELYLHTPFLWHLIGKQMFVVAKKVSWSPYTRIDGFSTRTRRPLSDCE